MKTLRREIVKNKLPFSDEIIYSKNIFNNYLKLNTSERELVEHWAIKIYGKPLKSFITQYQKTAIRGTITVPQAVRNHFNENPLSLEKDLEHTNNITREFSNLKDRESRNLMGKFFRLSTLLIKTT